MTTVCKNHPDREAKRKCHYCRATICAECQEKIAHHIYCSKSCYYLEIFERTVALFQMGISQSLRWVKQTGLFRWRNVFDGLLLIGIVVSIWIASQSYKLAQLKPSEVTVDEPIKKPLTIREYATHLDTLKVLHPLPSEMILRNTFDIEGEAEDNRIVSLSSGGKVLQVQIVKGKKFRFKNVVAKPGTNHFIVRSMREDGSSVVLEEIHFKFGKPTPEYLSRDFVRGNRNEKKLALTFDGGYLDNTTAEILDILKNENVRATFFLTGIYLRKYPEMVKRIVKENHVVGNHTWSHPHLTTFAQNGKHETLTNVTPEMIQQELLRTADLFQVITGEKMSILWRAPYGEHNREIRVWAAAAGFRHVGWTVGRNWEEGMDSMDWVADKNSPAYHTAEEIAEKIIAFGKGKKQEANGAVILMHLGTERQDDYPHLKLPEIIDDFKNRGYQFVTIPELL